jgi:O-antigen/teichoic acid export membrane protein
MTDAAERSRPVDRSRAMPTGLARNVVVNYATVAATALAGLIATPILVHQLGTVAFGVWALVGSIVAYLELLELGVGATTTKLVAEDAGRRDETVVKTLNTNFFVLGALGLVAGLGGLMLARVAPSWFDVPPDLHRSAQLAFAIATVAIAVSIPFDALGGTLTAYERIDLLSLSNMYRAIGAAAGGAVAALSGGGIVAVTLVTAAFGISAHALRWAMLSRLLPGLRLSVRLVDRSRLRRTLQLSWWFMLRDAMAVVVNRLDLVVVAVVLDLRAVAIYAVALKLSQAGIRALQPFTALFFPRASMLSADRDTEGLGLLLVDGTRVALAVATPVTLVLALLAHPLLEAWLGTGFDGAVPVLVLLAVATGVAAVTETAWWMLGGAGYIKWTSSLSVVEAVVNLTASVILASLIGPAGVAAGTLIGVVTSRLPVALAVAPRLAGLTTRTFVRRALVPHVVPAVATGLAVALIGPRLPAEVFPVLLAAAGAALLYFALYLRLGASPAETAELRRISGLRRPRHAEKSETAAPSAEAGEGER